MSRWLLTMTILSMVFCSSCQMPDWLAQWQKKQLDKRFGRTDVETQKSDIGEWQKEAAEYEDQLLKEIDLQTRAALVNRRIGSAFAELQSYELCIRHLEKAVLLGDNDAQTFYRLGLCYGNLARRQNWDVKLTRAAEENFIKSIHLEKNLKKGQYELALLYFHGYAGLNPYRILGETLTVEQRSFQLKAIELLEELLPLNQNDINIRFALAGMYSETKKKNESVSLYSEILKALETMYPDTFSNREDYRTAKNNIALIQNKIK